MIVLISFLVALLGLLLVAFSTEAKKINIGYITFGCGLGALLLQIGPDVVNLLGRTVR